MSQLSSAGAELNGTSFGNFPFVIPDSLKFTPVKQGLAARRVPVKIRSEQQTYSSNNNKLIRIILPNNAIYDTRSGYLTFTLNVSVTGGTYARVHTGVFSIFNRLRILASSTEVEDLRDYNRLYSALMEMLNPAQVITNVGHTQMGFGTQLERNAKSPQSDYACPLFSGVLNNELLPFDNLKSGVVLELTLEDGSMCIETDGTNPIITISNILFHMERVELDPSYRSFLSSHVRSNGLQLGFHTWERYISALTTGTNQNILINHRSSSMNGILNFLIDSTQLNNTLVNDRFLNWLPLSLTQTSILINGTIFPDEPVDTVFAGRYEAYQIYCRWVQKWKLNAFMPIAPCLSQEAFATSRFVFIDDLEPYPEEMDLINPFTTLGNNSTILKKLNFSAPIGAGYQLDSWVEYFRQVAIYTDGSVKVLQ
jgi:hypothetical protein